VNHLLYLSANIPKVSKEQGVPVVFTLHDYWLACARVNLLRQGVSRCDGPAPAQCACCCQAFYTRWPQWPTTRPNLVYHLKQAVKDGLFWAIEKPVATASFRQRASAQAALIRHTDLFIAPSSFLLEFMARHGVPREKLVHCDYGMTTELFSSCLKVPHRGRLRFGYVGTISHHKGIPVLLEAFDGFHEGELFLYGSRNDEILRSYAHVLAQENVHFEGELCERDKAGALSRLDALIVPSVWYENSPLVIHEAFLAGLPVITSDIGGMAELVTDGVNGVHFRAGDPIDLRRKLTESCVAPARLAHMASQLPHVKSMEEHTRELIGYYEQVSPGRISARKKERVPLG
jgi:glycosyltransferase involved in cell wall biosynthesis